MMFASALGSAPAYLESARAAGFAAEADAIGERVRSGDLRGAVAQVTDEMAAAMVMAGSAERVRAKIDGYRAAGLGGVHVLPAPPGGFYPLYEDHFPVESLSQLPEFDFPGLMGSFEARSSSWGSSRPSGPRDAVVDERRVLRLADAQVLQIQGAREPVEQALPRPEDDRRDESSAPRRGRPRAPAG